MSLLCSRVTPRALWPQNSFYREWSKPQGLIDAVSIILAREPAALGNITLSRHDSAGEVTESDLELLRLIAPHVRRAVTIGRLLDREASAAATFAATIEPLNVAVILVDDDLGIVHANRQGRDLLAARTSVRSDMGRLHLAAGAATAALRAAASRATWSEEQLGASGLAIPVGDRESPSVAHVWPLRRRQIRGEMIPHATVAVFIARAAVPPCVPRDALAVLYGFTPAESRIVELIVEGRTRGDIAKRLGIAPSTVKTHLTRIFGKTGLHRQVDLIQLVASLSVPT